MTREDWLAVKKLMQEKYMFDSIEHDRMIIAESEWGTSYLVSVHDVECDKVIGFPVDVELQSLSEEFQHYLEMGQWGRALAKMEEIDYEIMSKNN